MSEAIDLPKEELVPCPICSRTFLPKPFRTHIKICEKSSTKKRKPFNSLKQRVQGTDLADFHRHVIEHTRKIPEPEPEKPKPQSTWKQKHEELVRAIKAARGEAPPPPPPPVRRGVGAAVGTMGVTERCPVCDRQFGPKAFDRYVSYFMKFKASNNFFQNFKAFILC